MIEIGLRLKSERLRLNMKQHELADAGGVQANAQGRYERGERTPSASYLTRVTTFGIDILYVLTGKLSAASNISRGANEHSFIMQYLRLPEHERKLIANLTKCLSKRT